MKRILTIAATLFAVACYPSAKEVCEGSVETQCTVALRCAGLAPEPQRSGAIAFLGGDLAGCKTKYNEVANCSGQNGKAEAAVCSESTTSIDWGKIQDCRDELRDPENLAVCMTPAVYPAACVPQTGYCTGGETKRFIVFPGT